MFYNRFMELCKEYGEKPTPVLKKLDISPGNLKRWEGGASITADTLEKNLYLSTFKTKYQSWCRKNNYNYSDAKAEEIHTYARKQVSTLPMSDSVKLLITQSVCLLNSILEILSTVRKEMDRPSSQLPEYNTVMDLFGVGKVFGSQLMSEIGDTRRFHNRKAVTAFAGLDAPPYQSGNLDIKSRSISKRGSPSLRKTLFQVVDVILQKKPENNAVYQFLDKKRSEGKPYKVYMIAAANKLLRIYYARVNEILNIAG